MRYAYTLVCNFVKVQKNDTGFQSALSKTKGYSCKNSSHLFLKMIEYDDFFSWEDSLGLTQNVLRSQDKNTILKSK